MRSRLLLIVALALSACRSAPPYQGLEAADLHALAQREFEAGDYEEAARALNRLFVAFPSYGRTVEARLLLADAYFRDEQFITATAEYRRFLDRFPTDPQAPVAALGLCLASAATSPTIERDQSATEDAQLVCGNIALDYPGTPQGIEAGRIAGEMRKKLAEKLHTVAQYYFRRKFWDSSIVYWDMLEKQYPDTEFAPRALFGIMQAYEEIGYQDLVAETRQRILETYPTSIEGRLLAGDSATTATAGRSGGGL